MASMQEVRVCFRVGLSESTHSLFWKQHLVREESVITPSARTLLTLGWPPYANVDTVLRTYGRYGEVENVYLKRHPGVIRDLEEVNTKDVCNGFKVAYVVFKSEASLGGLLSNPLKKISVTLEDTDLGMSKWCREYMTERVDVSALASSADEFMRTYDKTEEEKESERILHEERDREDGWETPGRRGRGGQKRLLADVDGEQHKRKKKKKDVAVNFYAFQERERKRDHIAELRRKFEEDKLKVQAMRQARKFRPF